MGNFKTNLILAIYQFINTLNLHTQNKFTNY